MFTVLGVAFAYVARDAGAHGRNAAERPVHVAAGAARRHCAVVAGALDVIAKQTWLGFTRELVEAA